MPDPVAVAAFYRFVAVDEPSRLRDQLLERCTELGVRGSILVATEGINGTIAGSHAAIDDMVSWLRGDARFVDLEVKRSGAAAMPFLRLKVRRKREIVTFGRPVDPAVRVGRYIEPQDWNEVISDPGVLVIDTRNREEIELGSFANAIDPQTEAFAEFADYAATLDPGEHPRVAMFCTGGIRCEKATAYLLDRGFGDVMHLRGGILNYLEAVPEAQSLWHGECFVFDERVSVDHTLRQGRYTLCRGCRHPLAPDDLAGPGYEEGVSCRHCATELTPERAESLRERHRQVLLAKARGVDHLARRA